MPGVNQATHLDADICYGSDLFWSELRPCIDISLSSDYYQDVRL